MAETRDMSGGTKHDQEKVRLDLLSSRWLTGTGAVLTFGAKKYDDHNWRKGIKLSRLLAACLRHLFAFLGGEDRDPETGLSHLYHASCCLMFASELHETMPDMDDRYKGPASQTKSYGVKQVDPPPILTEVLLGVAIASVVFIVLVFWMYKCF